MSVVVALWLGLVQGAAELFPLSSLGILVVLPHIGPLGLHLSGARYLSFLVAVHVGTALALLVYFRRTWGRLLRGFARTVSGHPTPDGRYLWLIIWATVPGVWLGFCSSANWSPSLTGPSWRLSS